MTTTIISIRICERTVTPLGETANTQWIANLQDAPIAELQKARDYLGREISMREAEAPEYQFQPIDNSGGGGIVHEPFHLEPTPTAHKYTREEFERMGFDLALAKIMLVDFRATETAPFDGSETPQGLKFWQDQESGADITDEGRAALQDMIQQYEGLQHG